MSIMKVFILIVSVICVLYSCDTSKLKQTSESQFIGTWKLTERGMLDEIEIKISKSDDGKLSGSISKLNNNKYVQLFMSEGDVLISDIQRHSNFEFGITEKKIAAPLFSSYGNSTSTEFTAVFDGKSTILLGNKGTEGKYIKIK